MAHLRLHLVGMPEIIHGERVVAFPTRKALALLVYLAITREQHPRKRLVDLFWPGSSPHQGHCALRQTLAYLGTALKAAAGEDDREHLLVRRESLGFNFASAHDLDLRQFGTAVTLARTAVRPTAEDPAGRQRQLARLQAALALVRGDLLEGFSLADAPAFETWLAAQRATWREGLRVLCERLIGWQTELGDLAGARATIARWVARDPANETAHRRAIELECDAGDRAAALACCAAWRVASATAPATAPAAETAALLARARHLPARPPRDRCVAGPELPFVTTEGPVIGRDRERARFARLLRAIRRGQPAALVIAGERGIGKTRLLRACADLARAQGATVLNVPIEGEPGDSLIERIASSAAQGAVVYVLDDLAGAARDLLPEATRQWTARKVSILAIVALRGDLAGAQAWASQLATGMPVTCLALRPWSAEDVAQLVRLLGPLAVLPREAAEIEVQAAALTTLSRWLYAQTGGHPGATRALLQLLGERGVLQATTTGGGWVVCDLPRLTPALTGEVAGLIDRYRQQEGAR